VKILRQRSHPSKASRLVLGNPHMMPQSHLQMQRYVTDNVLILLLLSWKPMRPLNIPSLEPLHHQHVLCIERLLMVQWTMEINVVVQYDHLPVAYLVDRLLYMEMGASEDFRSDQVQI